MQLFSFLFCYFGVKASRTLKTKTLFTFTLLVKSKAISYYNRKTFISVLKAKNTWASFICFSYIFNFYKRKVKWLGLFSFWCFYSIFSLFKAIYVISFHCITLSNFLTRLSVIWAFSLSRFSFNFNFCHILYFRKCVLRNNSSLNLVILFKLSVWLLLDNVRFLSYSLNKFKKYVVFLFFVFKSSK